VGCRREGEGKGGLTSEGETLRMPERLSLSRKRGRGMGSEKTIPEEWEGKGEKKGQ